MKFFCALLFITVPVLGIQPPPETVFIRVNQVGYLIDDSKIGMAFSSVALPKSFALVDARDNAPVFRGAPKILPGEKWGQFTNHAELDFSEFKTPVQPKRGQREWKISREPNVFQPDDFQSQR